MPSPICEPGSGRSGRPGSSGRRRRPGLDVGRVLAALALVASAAGTGRAQDGPTPEARSQARTFLVEGAARLKRADYGGALASFEAAYGLVPSAKIHFNFGLAYQGLGRRAEALAAFERFLDESADADEGQKRNARRQREKLLPQVAVVEVDCPETGARLTLDGRPAGTTPLRRPLYADPGPHRLAAEAPGAGRLPFREDFTARAAERLKVLVRFPPAPVLSPPLAHRPERPPGASAPVAAGGGGPPVAVLPAGAGDSAPVTGGPAPFYRRWWFWTAVATAAAASATGAVLISRSRTDPSCPDPPCTTLAP